MFSRLSNIPTVFDHLDNQASCWKQGDFSDYSKIQQFAIRSWCIWDVVYKNTRVQWEIPLELHSHSTYSDGRSTPCEIVEETIKYNALCAITDHNEYRWSLAACKLSDRIIPAMELNTTLDDYRGRGIDLQIFAKNPDHIQELHSHIQKYINPKQPWAQLKIDFIEVLKIIHGLQEIGKEIAVIIAWGYTNKYKYTPWILEQNASLVNDTCHGYENNTPFFSKITASPEKLKQYIHVLNDEHDIRLLECFWSDAHHKKHLFSSTMAYEWAGPNITVNNVIDALLSKDIALIPQQATRLWYWAYFEHAFLHLSRSHVEKLSALYLLQCLHHYKIAPTIQQKLMQNLAKKDVNAEDFL